MVEWAIQSFISLTTSQKNRYRISSIDSQTSNALYTSKDRMIYVIDFVDVSYASFIVDVATNLFLFLTNGVHDTASDGSSWTEKNEPMGWLVGKGFYLNVFLTQGKVLFFLETSPFDFQKSIHTETKKMMTKNIYNIYIYILNWFLWISLCPRFNTIFDFWVYTIVCRSQNFVDLVSGRFSSAIFSYPFSKCCSKRSWYSTEFYEYTLYVFHCLL